MRYARLYLLADHDDDELDGKLEQAAVAMDTERLVRAGVVGVHGCWAQRRKNTVGRERSQVGRVGARPKHDSRRARLVAEAEKRSVVARVAHEAALVGKRGKKRRKKRVTGKRNRRKKRERGKTLN